MAMMAAVAYVAGASSLAGTSVAGAIVAGVISLVLVLKTDGSHCILGWQVLPGSAS